MHERNPNYRYQQFRVTYRNELLDTDLVIHLRMDGEVIRRTYLPAGHYNRIVGVYKNSTSLLPFKFQELELVGTFTCLVSETYRPSSAYPKTQTWKMLPSCLKWGLSKH